MAPLLRRQAIRVSLAAALAASLGGCDFSTAPEQPAVVERPFQGAELKLAIAGDPGVAAAVKRMQGDWSGATGAKLTVVEIDPSATPPADADVVVASPARLGEWAALGLLSPLDESRLARTDLDWNGVFEGVRQGDARFGSFVHSLPLGERTLVVYARQDWLDGMKLAAPKTWAEYQQVATALANRPVESADAKPVAGAAEPLGPGWAGLTLLTRAAPYAKDAGHYSTLFDVDDMHAQIASPAFVRALDELKAVVAPREVFDALAATPDDARRAMLEGRAGLALCWPARSEPNAPAASDAEGEKTPAISADALSIHPVPGATEVYNLSRKAWQPRKSDDGPRVPLSGVAGRAVAVTKAAKNPDAAFELAASLVGGRWGGAIRRSSVESGPCRKSDLADAQAFVGDPAERRAATQYVDAVAATFDSPDRLDALRIPGRDRYLAALDDAVRKCVRGEADAATALGEAAREWERITDELGRDKQAAAYRKSVGYE